MKELRRYSYLVLVAICLLASLQSWGQFAQRGYVTSMGGGVATGGTFSTSVVAGDPSASATIANGDLFSIYPGFIPGNMIILSFGLTKDSTVLAIIYEATRGAEWTNGASQWFTNPDLSQWEGIEVTNQRVTGINLSGKNLQERLPAVINNMSKLDSLVLRDNQLRGIPDLKGLPSLRVLDVSLNRLGFQDLITNLDSGLTTYNYAPQKRFGFTKNDTAQAGLNRVIKSSIPGVGNQYQWIFDDFGAMQDSVAIAGATLDSLVIDSVTFDQMGAYRLVATNPGLPDLTLQTRNQNLWATTTLTGTVFADNLGTLLDTGKVSIYRIVNDGPYTLSDSAFIQPNGQYIIEDLVLGDFIVRSDPVVDLWPDVIQTYYVSTDDWLNADTLLVRSVVDNIDIQMVFKPVYTPNPVGATVNGLVESDFSEDIVDEENARINARRKVKKAGCSLRRRTRSGGGRGNQEDEYTLFAYVESDDNGEFNFPEIPDGVYRLNIQYPGVPMDTTSQIEFTVGGDFQEQVFQVSATITDDGIVVQTKEVLSVRKPYLKDLVIYPNPTRGMFAADYTINRKINSLKLELTTIQGMVILDQKANSQLGSYRATMDLSRLSAGIYFLVFSDEESSFRHQVKVVKQ